MKKQLLLTVFFSWLIIMSYSRDIIKDTIPENSNQKFDADTIKISNQQKDFLSFANTLDSRTKTENDSLKKEKVKIEALIKDLEKDLNKNEIKIKQKKEELNNIDNQIDYRNLILKKLTAQINDVNNTFDSLKSKETLLKKANDSINKQTEEIQIKSDSLKKKNNEAVSQLNNLLTEIAKKEDSLEAIAKIRIKSDVIAFTQSKNTKIVENNSQLQNKLSSFDFNKSTYSEIQGLVATSPNSHIDSLKIRKIHLSVKEGRITEIIVTTNNGIFRNMNSPIDLVHFRERRYRDRLYKDDLAFTQSKNNDTVIFLYPGDVITYEPIRSYGDIPYSEFEITLTPDSLNNEFLIRESSSINTYFDISVFTDIKGISGDANGIAQITGSAKFITSTRNIKNSSLIPFQYVAFNGGLSKFDNDFKGTYLYNIDSINRKDLFQRSQYSVGLKLNLLHWIRSPYPKMLIQDIQFNTGFNFVGSRIADTLTKKSDTLYKTITHNQFYIEPLLCFARQKNFNMCVSIPFYYQNLKASSAIFNREWEWWVCPSINLMYYSKRDSKSKIFFRYNHFINLKNTKQAFVQLQLGFSSSLTSLIQGN